MPRSAAVTRKEAHAGTPAATRRASSQDPVHAQVLSLQRSAGNRAVTQLLQSVARAPALDEAAIDRDVEAIAALLKQQALWASDERRIVSIFERHQGTPGLNRLIGKLKGKVIVRATARSAWQDTWVNAWDTLFYELEDSRLETFRSIVASGSKHAAAPERANSENFFSTLGEQEAIGMMGAVKGLSTGAAGVVDLGAWAVTTQANAVLKPMSKALGTDVTLAQPIKLADEVGKGWDEIGDMTFGKKKWSEGDKLLPGVSAAEIGNLGGSIIWSLTMLGAGGGSSQAKALLTGIDLLGKVKSVEDQCTSMAAYLERKGKEGPITWPALRDDAEFWVECTKLAGAIASAVALGATSEKGAAATIKKALEGVAPYLRAAEITAKVAQIIQILNHPKLPPKVKEEQAAKIVGELIATAFDLVGGKAQKRDEARAKSAADSKARVDQAREQIRSEPAGALDAPVAETAPAGSANVVPVAPGPIPIPYPLERAGGVERPAATHAEALDALNAIGDDDFHFTADDGLHTIAMDDPEFRAPPEAPPAPVKSEALDPGTLRGTHGMPERNQQKLQDVVDRLDLVVDVRPTTAAAPGLLEQGAIPKFEDLKSKTIGPSDRALGATAQEGEVGFFKPHAEGDLAGPAAERWWQRDMEFWDNATKMTELQKPVGEQHGTKSGKQVAIGADGSVKALDPEGGAPKTITGDHDVYDIRKADGSPLTREEYLQVLQVLKEGKMGIEHGAHARWAEDLGRPMTPAEKLVYDAIVRRHASGKEPVIRFSPNRAPQTAGIVQ
jgi:hypothetical protein